MKRARCPRAWEAEAIEVGRLDDSLRESFKRHAAACAVCAREREILTRLRAMGAELPSPVSSPLDRKRLRTIILRNAYGDTPRGARRHRLPRSLAVAVSILFVLGGGALLFRPSLVPRRAAQARTTIATAPTFEMVPIGSVSWQVDRADNVVHASLERGRVAVHVGKLAEGQRFVVALPDGELEVRGTRFVLEARDGQTRSVDVVEGTVVLRLGSDAPRNIVAGESWVSDTSLTPAVASAPTYKPIAPAPAPRSSPFAGAATPADTRAPAASRSARAPAESKSPGTSFAEAMAVYGAGAWERADKMLADFTSRYPNDSRCEDAAFLRIVVHQRMGDAKGEGELARRYLAQFPAGLRRGEVDALLREGHAP